MKRLNNVPTLEAQKTWSLEEIKFGHF